MDNINNLNNQFAALNINNHPVTPPRNNNRVVREPGAPQKPGEAARVALGAIRNSVRRQLFAQNPQAEIAQA